VKRWRKKANCREEWVSVIKGLGFFEDGRASKNLNIMGVKKLNSLSTSYLNCKMSSVTT
jgi:hypothetical protein